MPGYSFQVGLTLENTDDKDLVIRLPRGTLIEPSSTVRTQQSAVVAKDYVFRLNPKEIRPVLIEAECWNRQLAAPSKAPGVITPFAGKIQDTTDVWTVSSHGAKGAPIFSPRPKTTLSEFVAEVGGEWACSLYEFVIKKSTDTPSLGHSFHTSRLLRRLQDARADLSKQADTLLEIGSAVTISGADLREWLIRSGIGSLTSEPSGDDDSLRNFITSLYAFKQHELTSVLYQEYEELLDLKKRMSFSLGTRKEELRQIIRVKILSIIDALPELDKIAEFAKAA